MTAYNKLRAFLDQCGTALEKTAQPLPLQCIPPRELHFELTYRCNTSCVMCNLRYLNPGSDELSARDIERMVNGSSLLNDLRFIVLSGGEPWLKEDFIDILRILRTKYPQTEILILSNLIDADLAVRRLEEIRAAVGLEHISIGSSLDGIGDVQDKVRGRKGSFAALQNALSVIKARYPQLFVSLNFTVLPENCDQIVPAFTWSSENKYHISYQVLVQKKETREFVWEEKHITAVEEQLNELVEQVSKNFGVHSSSGYELMANEGILSLMLSIHYIGKYIRERKRYFPCCPCGEKYAMVSPEGNIYFCPVHKNKIAGNLRKSTFDGIWKSREAEDIRNFFDQRRCHCWLTCTNGYMLEKALADGKQSFINTFFNKR